MGRARGGWGWQDLPCCLLLAAPPTLPPSRPPMQSDQKDPLATSFPPTPALESYGEGYISQRFKKKTVPQDVIFQMHHGKEQNSRMQLSNNGTLCSPRMWLWRNGRKKNPRTPPQECKGRLPLGLEVLLSSTTDGSFQPPCPPSPFTLLSVSHPAQIHFSSHFLLGLLFKFFHLIIYSII